MPDIENYTRKHPVGLFIILLLLVESYSYLIIVNETKEPGTVIFNASVYKLGSERTYKINTHRSAHYIRHLLHVNSKDGQIRLKKSLKCDGIYYPHLFTFYVDSVTTRLRSIDYYSLPLRIFITGQNCNDDLRNEKYGHLENEEHPISKRRRRNILNYSHYLSYCNNIKDANCSKLRNEDFQLHRAEWHMIYNRNRRSSPGASSKLRRNIVDAKQFISETYASYAIHTTDKWNKVCLKQSQFINSLNAFLPRSICQNCQVNFLDVNDERFKIELKNRDLVASHDVCIHEPIWKVIITFNIRCNRNDIVNSDHRLKIVYHYQAFNDTDIAKRVRRELRNQSPYFEQALYVASVLEEQPPRALVTTVRARDPEDSPVVYSIESLLDSRSQSMFKVDSRTGIVTTSSSLDRELMDVHYFRVVAIDDSFPPRSGTTTLQVNVLDCNDHNPTFEAEQFEASIREGATVGTTVIALRASDQDIGKNAEIEYGIESVTGGGTTTHEQDSQAFRIDTRTGVIMTKSILDRESCEIYTMIVTATDLATPQSERKSATASVVITVLDDNDNYPQFSERTYTIQVSEDNWDDNKVVAHIHAADADQGNNAAIRYAIIGGNTQSQFTIDSMNGDVSLVKPLDYEIVHSYRLVIRAQDGGSPSRSNTTQLLVNVIDANDNAPRFYTSQFQESVLESVPIGYNIIRVQAYDSDEGANAEITYSISERDDNFPLAVDRRTGWVQSVRQLDREDQARYSFQVIAVDGGIPPKSASSTVVITIQDVNDNDPTFRPQYYEATIGEDQPPGTPVTIVTATDPDEDSRLHYEITSGNTRGRFAITSQNGRGLLTIAQSLDYKQERRFLLVITATDSGGRTDTANVNINITDANNFAPMFENAPYSASVFEDAPIGTTVFVVSATDSDVGINAQITYSLNDESVNGLASNDPFTINSKTGAIITSATLDRESTSGYLLTVTAKDGGNPSLSDTTDIEISITDVNDNAPVFKVPLYQATISEDALIGTSVVQIAATDLDIGLNGRVQYLMSDKDVEDGSFVVDPTSGTIRTNKALDRESIATYYLTAIAFDKGTPPMSSSVEVQIRLDDVNDSPPIFSSDKLTLYVPENSPVGSFVGEICAHDPDEGVNAIVHYSIIGGDDSSSFSLVTRPGSERAQLLTMTELDYESPRKRFELVVRAASPPLRNDVHVEILVTDVNDNAPILKDFQVIFNNFRDYFPNGEIGRIPAFDADVTDKLTYRILSGNNANLIRLNTSSGGLILSPQLNTNVPRYASMEVSVTDGINEAKAVMQLVVRLITEDMLFNSVTVRLNEMTEEAFLSPLLNFFLDGLAAIIPCSKENIFIFSVQDDTEVNSRILNVSFSAMRPDVTNEEYYTSQYLQERVYLNRAILARLATVEVLPFDDNLCVREPCLNYEQCLTVLKFGNASAFIHSDTVLFRPIYPVNTFACQCPEGFTGSKEHYLCDTEVDLCYSNPCQHGGKCLRREGGYTCICEHDFTGLDCETEIKNLKMCKTDLCQGGYSCLQHGDIGRSSYSSTCELKSRSFTRNSFITFERLRQRHRFNIKLNFATLEQDGLLLYNGRYNELHDFIALEIIEGHLSFSFSLGDSKQNVRVNQKKKLSDGLWHTVEVIYFNRTVTLVVDNCDTALALSGDFGDRWSCANQTTLTLDKRCSSLTESCHRFLDLTGPLQLGGLPRIPVHFPIRTQDYVGCISELIINHRFIDLNSYVADNGTMSGCPQKAPSCMSEPCFNGGTCNEGWNTHTCECPEGYTGSACQEAVPAPWRFSGDGVLSFNPLLRPIQLPWLTGLSIRTRQQNAFLVQIQVGQNSSAILSLKQGILYYSYDNESMYLAATELADGIWHRIEIKWLSAEIYLSVDYGQRTEIFPMARKIQGQYVGKIVIGRADESIGNTEKFVPYVGCIQDIRVGGMQSVLNRPTVRENVEDGCASKSQCPQSCPDYSACIMNWDESHCDCLPGYIGPDCAPVCTVSPCTAGICRADISQQKGYRCECNNTIHSGEFCETTIQRPCPAGWWGEKRCGPCKCNIGQGYNPDCNKTTGQCHCKDNHYQPINETACLPCDCYSIGSFSSSCNHLNGQCECRESVIGRRCDSCSNPYAEVTLAGCEVVYDACPRSYSAGIWWSRTPLGQVAVSNCPIPAKGKGSRLCDDKVGRWGHTDMFNCTSQPFIELRKQLSQLEKSELQLNPFVSIKIGHSLRHSCQLVSTGGNIKRKERGEKEEKADSFFFKKDRRNVWNNEFENYLNEEVQFIHDRLYGVDILITEGLLTEVINFELTQRGLNLSHSQDKDFVENLVFCAGVILNRKYKAEWHRITQLVNRGPHDLVDAFNKYMIILAQSQHDTYTKPFEIVQKNMAFGLDTVTSQSLFGYEPEQLSEYHRVKFLKPNQFTTESVILPDTSAFLQHSAKQKPVISIPKYNNYLQDKTKFDRNTKVLIPLEILGITPPEKNEITSGSSDYRVVMSYAQYKDVGILYPESFDETITRRWGVDLQIVSPVLSLAILVPGDRDEFYAEVFSKDLTTLKTNKNKESFHSPKKQIDGVNDAHKEIEIMAHDIDVHKIDDTKANSEKQIEFSDEAQINENLESEKNGTLVVETILSNIDIENEPMYSDLRLKRQIEDPIQLTEKQFVYRSLGSPHLSQAIQLQMSLIIDQSKFGPRSNPQCVRWNSFTNSWTRLGCQTEIPNYEIFRYDFPISINCTCTHISNYAVLVDVIDPEDIPEPSLLVQITSYSAFLLSLPILVLVLIALTLLRGMQTNSNTIHQNIVLCVFCAELLFFISMQSRRSLIDNEFPCKLVAILLHYTWLAAFAWTTVDCVHLYRMLNEMRDINHGPMGFYFSVGYGAPAIIVGLSVGVRAHEYGNNLFCWLSVYEPVVWWLVGPIGGMSIINLFILFVSVKSAFTLKDHILGFGNLRTLLWLSVVSLPIMGVMWVLAVLVASDSSQFLSISLCCVVLVHAVFCLIGYCVINKRVRENLHMTFLRCIGRKVPLLDSSIAVSNSLHNTNTVGRGSTFLAGAYDTTRRNIGISASSTTSRSTAKTSSSPYRSDGQLRHTSTSTSNYNSASETPSYMRGFVNRPEGEKKKRHRKDSDSESETDGRSLELASSHSSDDEESRVGRNSGSHRNTGVSTTPYYLPNITEHVHATTPPELNVVQSPQLFPSVNKPIYASRWSSQLPEAYLPSSGNVGRWSQETGSDNEILSYKTNSPNPLPNPDLTDTQYLNPPQYKMNTENQKFERNEKGYEMEHEAIRVHEKDYDQINADNGYEPTHYESEKQYERADIVNHLKTLHNNPYLNNTLYDKQRYIGYDEHIRSKELITPNLYSRDNTLKSPALYGESVHSVHSLLKNDYQQYQQRVLDYHSDRMSEGSDKNGYHFPYTAEEDHLNISSSRNAHHLVNDMNAPSVISSQLSSRHPSPIASPTIISPMQPLSPLRRTIDPNKGSMDDDETTV